MPKRGGDDEDDSASAPASALESQNDKVCDDPSPFGLPMCGNPAFPSSGRGYTHIHHHHNHHHHDSLPFKTRIRAKGGSNESLWKSSSTAEGEEEEEEVEEICLVGPKGKKKRMTLSQANFLETTFMEDYINKALEPGRKAAIAKELELEPRQVAVWFQNRRARWKNKQLETNYNMLKEKLSFIAKQNQQLQAEVTRLSNLLKSLEIEHDEDNCGKAFKRAKIEVENNMAPTSINPMGLEICDKELPKLTSDNEEEKSGSEFYDTPCTLASSNGNIINPQCDELLSKMHNNMQLGLDDCLIVEQPPQFQLVGDMYNNPTALLFHQLTAFKLEGAYFPLLEEQPNISLNFEDQQEVSFLGMAISLTPRNGEEEEEEEGMSPWVNYW